MDPRAVSFGIHASRYNSHRPGYPGALVDRLTADRPNMVLDIGCGTGIASRLLTERGCSVLGVEADERMAAFARANGIRVDTAPFEKWEPRGRIFDLVVCAQAWWWLDRPAALSKIADVLPTGGRLGIFWNVGGREDELTLALQDVYERAEAEGVAEPMRPTAWQPDVRPELEADDRFRDVEVVQYKWEQRYSRDEWVAAAATFGDVIVLPPEQRDDLLAAVGATVDAHGGFREVHVVTSLVTAVRSEATAG
jgi:SAM-dependent methyltransferase